MSESLDGFSVAATRQNAGRLRKACAATAVTGVPLAVGGGVNAPASTACARVIVVLGRVSDARLSQDRAPAAVSPPPTDDAANVLATKRMVVKTCFISLRSNSNPDFEHVNSTRAPLFAQRFLPYVQPQRPQRSARNPDILRVLCVLLRKRAFAHYRSSTSRMRRRSSRGVNGFCSSATGP